VCILMSMYFYYSIRVFLLSSMFSILFLLCCSAYCRCVNVFCTTATGVNSVTVNKCVNISIYQRPENDVEQRRNASEL